MFVERLAELLAAARRAFYTVVGRGRIRLGKKVFLGRSVALRPGSGGRIAIGNRSWIMAYARLIAQNGTIEIGEDCTINPFCVLYGHGGLKLGNKVRVATHVILIPAQKRIDDPRIPIMSQGSEGRGIDVGDDVWIGANAVVLDGVTVGTGAVIGAGSVVTRDVPPYHVVAGVPATTIRVRSERPAGIEDALVE